MAKQLARDLKKIKDQTVNLSHFLATFSPVKQNIQHFIILTRERSGSTCLLDLIASHSNIKTDPHIFYTYSDLPQAFNQKTIRSKKNIHGFKFKVQPSFFELTDENCAKAKAGLTQLTERGVKIIYLERENLIRQSVSWLLADCAKLRKQNYKKSQKPIKIKSMKFDTDMLLRRIQRFEQLSNFEHTTLDSLSYLHLSYEKDLMQEKRHQTTLDRICDFLDIKSAKAITRYAKISSNDLRKSISNYQEIYDFLKGTKYFEQLNY